MQAQPAEDGIGADVEDINHVVVDVVGDTEYLNTKNFHCSGDPLAGELDEIEK